MGGAVANDRYVAKSAISQLLSSQNLQEKYLAPRGTFQMDMMIEGISPMNCLQHGVTRVEATHSLSHDN